MKQIILDTETTGLDYKTGHKLIEIACVEIENRKFTGKEFHSYLNPERSIDPGAVKIHGLSRDFLSDKPKFSEIYNELLDFVKDSELLIHNAEFDLGFLNNELRQNNIDQKIEDHVEKVIDTLLMARQMHPGQRNSLDVLTDRYNIQGYDRSYHGALIDSKILGEVYLSMTGGQTDLNLSSGITKKTTNETKVSLSSSLIKISASVEENLAHKNYLKSLHENNN